MIKIFRRRYPKGKNYVVTTDINHDYEKYFDGLTVSFVSLETMIRSLSKIT